MKISIISDVHIEFSKWKNIPTGDILIIAGDLGNPNSNSYMDLLKSLSNNYKHINIICGNHEYYSSSIENVEKLMKSINIDNVHYLQCDSHIIGGYQFLGCTLWTNPQCKRWKINDGRFIKDFSVTDMRDLHQNHRKWLFDELSKPKDEGISKRIVITHHLPSYQCIAPKYLIYGDSNDFFASDCDDLVGMSDAWIAGHTHTKMIVNVQDVNVYINPRGYPGENDDYDYYSPLTIDI